MNTEHRIDAVRPLIGLFLALALSAAFAFPALAEGNDYEVGCYDTATDLLFICKCSINVSCEDFCAATGVVCAPKTDTSCATQCKSIEPVQADVLRTHGLSNPLVSATIPDLIGRVVQIFTGIVGSLALLMFVYGGMLWVTSRGNSEQVEKGKKIFTWSTIGLVIIFGAYLILRVLFQTIGATS